MGAVSAFTDRNLSLPTSELVLDGAGADTSYLDGAGAVVFCWCWSSWLLLGWCWSSCLDEAVVSCLDGVQLCLL